MSAWELDDAEQRHAASPRSFFIPPAELRRSLVPGALVKLLFVGPQGVGYLTDLWPELAEPFRDGVAGEEWIWDGSAYRRAT